MVFQESRYITFSTISSGQGDNRSDRYFECDSNQGAVGVDEVWCHWGMVVQWSIPVWNLFFLSFNFCLLSSLVLFCFLSCLVGFLESFMGGPWVWTVVYLFPLAMVNVSLLNNEKLKVNHTIVWEAGHHFGTRNMLVLCLNIYTYLENHQSQKHILSWSGSTMHIKHTWETDINPIIQPISTGSIRLPLASSTHHHLYLQEDSCQSLHSKSKA